jgi:hypothetical protein
MQVDPIDVDVGRASGDMAIRPFPELTGAVEPHDQARRIKQRVAV